MPRERQTICRLCGSEDRVDRGRCKSCMRDYDAAQKRKRAARRREAMGEAAYLASMRQKAKGLRVAKPAKTAKTAKAVRQYERRSVAVVEPVVPVLTRGRRIPAADAPMAERLLSAEWVKHYEREGMLEWAQKEAGK